MCLSGRVRFSRLSKRTGKTEREREIFETKRGEGQFFLFISKTNVDHEERRLDPTLRSSSRSSSVRHQVSSPEPANLVFAIAALYMCVPNTWIDVCSITRNELHEERIEHVKARMQERIPVEPSIRTDWYLAFRWPRWSHFNSAFGIRDIFRPRFDRVGDASGAIN